MFPPCPWWCYQRAGSVPAALHELQLLALIDRLQTCNTAKAPHLLCQTLSCGQMENPYEGVRALAVREKQESTSLNALQPISFAYSYEQEIHPDTLRGMMMIIATHFQGSGTTFFVCASVSCCCCVVEPARGHTRSTEAL